MTDNTDQRLERLEGGFDKIVVILDGKPVLDIKGNLTGKEGGLVQQGERHAEALHIIDRKIDGLLPRRWTLSQRLKATGICVAFIAAASSVIARVL